jgi:hypothetical protein
MTHARTLSKVDCMSDTKKCGLISLNNIKFFFSLPTLPSLALGHRKLTFSTVPQIVGQLRHKRYFEENRGQRQRI